MPTSLVSRLRAALLAGKNLSEELKYDDSRPLPLADARQLCEFLAEQADVRPLIDTSRYGNWGTPLYHLVMPFQADADEVARKQLRTHGLPQLLRLCGLALTQPDPPGHPFTMIAKMFALYRYEPGVSRVAAVARRCPDEYKLSVSFGIFGDERHPHGPALVEQLRDPLPTGFTAILTLDLANALSRQERLHGHPFDTPAGHQKLESWLADPDPEHASYAVSAAASLPFLDDGARNRLAGLALDHADPKVQMEAAWASAYRGGQAGLRFLASMATDARFGLTAQQYLEELGRADVIPEEARDPEFLAMAQMCRWLAHPNEFGRPPREIELYDTRELFWPPTGDTRQVWLFRTATRVRTRTGVTR
jgi:hypothetical protein